VATLSGVEATWRMAEKLKHPEPLEQFYVCLKAPARIGSVQTSSGDSPPKVRFAVDSPVEGEDLPPMIERKKAGQ
jgi:hypothetical protein